MNIKTTSSHHEHSITVERPDGTKLDFVSMPDEVTIGQTNPDGTFADIPLTIPEAQELHKHLTNILG